MGGGVKAGTSDMSNWVERLEKLADIYSRLPVEVSYHLERPATEAELDRLEMEVGWLPRSFRRFFLTVSRSLYFKVRVLDGFLNFPEELWSEYGIYLSLDRVRHGEEARENWCRRNRGRRALDGQSGRLAKEGLSLECARRWNEAIGFLNLPDGELPDHDRAGLALKTEWGGDVLAFDLSDRNPDPRVIYLSHDDADCHGQVLGLNFIDFMNRLLNLGGYGGVLGGWAMCETLDQPPSIYCPEAIALRRVLGLMPPEGAMH